MEEVTHSRVTISEKGKSVTFRNAARLPFRKLRVDNCLITNGARADWIITKVGVASAVVELKGRDVRHAIDQLFETIAHPESDAWLENPVKLLIICAKFPSFDTQVARAQLRAKRMGMSLKIVCRTFECDIENL